MSFRGDELNITTKKGKFGQSSVQRWRSSEVTNWT